MSSRPAGNIEQTALASSPRKNESVLPYVFSPPVLKRSLAIALIVGCVLSIANQYDLLLSTPMNPRLGVKIFFNFLVPFGVSSSSAAAHRENS